ncbi:MAG: archaellum biogenesis protein FlaJ (TadC family), partial [Roseivirga sp.]
MKKLAEKVNFIHVFILTFTAIAMLTITQSGNSYEALNCSGTLVTVSCHDAPSWSE